MMKRLLLTVIIGFILLIPTYSQDTIEWNDYLKQNFEELSIPEQVKVFATYLADDYGPHMKRGSLQINRTLQAHTTTEAIPYLRYYLMRSDLDYDGSVPFNISNVTVINILGLITYRIWTNKNLDPSIGLWFADQAESKVLRYITKYKRIDTGIMGIEYYIYSIKNLDPVTLTVKNYAPPRWENSAFWGKLLYEKYVVKNGLVPLDIGITENMKFSGYSGRLIPIDPIMNALGLLK
jgi:hypothetical protein